MGTDSSEIKCYHFLSRKYGRELLLDIGRIENLKNFVLDTTLHQISFYEVMLIEKGKGTFSLDENRTVLGPGTVIFTSPGQVRRWDARDVEGYTLFFEKDFLNLFFTDDLFLYRFQFFHQYARPTSMKMPSREFRRALDLVRGVEEEFMLLRSDSSHLLRAILYQLLVLLNRHYATVYQVESDTHVHPDFFRFRSLLEKEFMAYHRVTDYTEVLRISSTHLNKVCRQYSGLTAQQMIHQRLISSIKRELRCNRSVKEIAYDFDFSDPSNFNRFFKKITGTTAQQYRDGL
ncbi:MAG: helix-turn-helix domain-containing protein [Bacteroidetes bacterium]|nr:helix-turn-helix domain-containing protein [Bacteroidota bacterium]